MKKQTKLLVLVMSLALLICSSLAIMTTAEEVAATPTLDIWSKNVSFKSNVVLSVAVKAENVGDSDVELLVYNEYPTESSTPVVVAPYGSGDVWGANCRLFATPGVNAKNLADQVYLQARALIDGAYVYSEVEQYSVVEYCKEMVFTEGTMDENDADFNAIIEYGASVQRILGHNTDKLATDYKYVTVENGTFGTLSRGIVLAGDKITLTHTGEATKDGASFIGYKDSISGQTYNVGEEITVNGDMLLVENYLDTASLLTFDDMEEGDLGNIAITETTISGGWLFTGSCPTVPFATAKYQNVLKALRTRSSTNTHIALSVEKMTEDSDGNSLKLTTAKNNTLAVVPTKTAADFNHFVYSADYTLNYTGSDATPWINFAFSGDNLGYRIRAYYRTATGVLEFRVSPGDSGATEFTFYTMQINDAETPRDLCETFNLQFEYWTHNVKDGVNDYILVISVNGKQVFIMDTADRHTSSGATEKAYLNTDGAYVVNEGLLGFYVNWPSVPARFATLENNFEGYEGIVYMDNIQFVQSVETTLPTLNRTAK